MASPDSHRWAIVSDALDRVQTAGGSEIHIRLLKTIAIIDLFKERSGLVPSLEMIRLALRDQPNLVIEKAITDLQDWSLIIHRRFSNGYSIFEGSDFDIEQAIEEAYGSVGELDFPRLTALAGLQPVIAKRHYHETGTLRWCDTAVVSLGEVESAIKSYLPSKGSAGAFFFALPTMGDSQEKVERIVHHAVARAVHWDIVVGIPDKSNWAITTISRDLMALEQVNDNTPELQGDRIARLEVQSRIAELQVHLENELRRALDNALWYQQTEEPKRLDRSELNSLASAIADARYSMAPKLHNELLNRIKPSSNAVAARNNLLRHMALCEGGARLDIEGYPPRVDYSIRC